MKLTNFWEKPRKIEKEPEKKPKLAVVVSYRNREENRAQFIPHIRDYLGKAGIDFTIFIVEQADDKPFNRGKLMNIGFRHAEKDHDYFCFHDVDMLPVDVDYSFAAVPTHLVEHAVPQFMDPTHEEYFGGVTIFDKGSYNKINGFSNEFWGWGAEDDDLRNRVIWAGMKPERRKNRFTTLSHFRYAALPGTKPDVPRNRELLWDLMKNPEYYKTEGLNTLSYELLSVESAGGYTLIRAIL